MGGAMRIEGLSGGVGFENVTAAENMAIGEDGETGGSGGVFFFAEPGRVANTIALRGITAWGNRAGRGGVLYGTRLELSMSGMVAYNNSAYVAGVAYCNDCDMVGTQMDSLPMLRCQPKDPTSTDSMAITAVVAGIDWFRGRYPEAVAALLEQYQG